MNGAPNSVLNGFLAAFGAATPPPAPIPPALALRLEATRAELERELLMPWLGQLQLRRHALEAYRTHSDPHNAGEFISALLEQRGWPLLRLETRPWGYALVADAGDRAVALCGLVFEAEFAAVWLTRYELPLN